MPILAAMSSDGIHFALTEEAQGLSPESPASLLHYEGGGGDTGAMRAWRDPEFLRDDQGTVLSRGVGGYRYVYFSAHVPRRASMLVTLKMCGSGGDQGDCEQGWFRGTIGVARIAIEAPPGAPWEVLGPAAYLSVKTYIERDPMSIVATNQTGFWEMERPQVGPGEEPRVLAHP